MSWQRLPRLFIAWLPNLLFAEPLMFSKKTNLRVVSYNVLSSELARPSFYTTYDPEDLKATNRLPVVLKKLEQEIDKSDKVIVCLQEVSYSWAGELHTFFAGKGYHLVTGLYGKSFNGYMGVAMAWPTNKFEVENVDICRLSDVREGGWPARDEKPEETTIQSLYRILVDQPLLLMGLSKPPEKPLDPWAESERRFNVLLTTVLRDKETGQSFCVGNYHMPCVFWAPTVMVIHATMAARRVQQIAARQKHRLPYILAGDFNLKPKESVYRLLVTGELHKDDDAWPAGKNGTEFSTEKLQAMDSAYAVAGQEPDFTNFARVKDQEAFCDVLDYIFLSKGHWKVSQVLELPHRDKSGGPFPNLASGEPSDHLLIAAQVELQSK